MIPENYRNFLAIAKQLPQFIRDEESYETFIYFLQSYYEWLAQPLNIEDRAKNILNYKDIDNTLDEFEQFFFNEFLQYFPEDTLIDKRKLVKFSKEIYRRKSTPASFKFLFRSIYGSDCETTETEQFVLKASDGKWAASRTVKLDTLDSRFLQIDNYLIFGETSKAVGKIEKSQVSSKKIEIFLSDINRSFISGETVRIVDSTLNDVIIDGSNLVSKIVGLVRSIIPNSRFKGLNYNVGDPVILFGGLNENIDNPIGATALVSEVNPGSVGNITLTYGSQGFRPYPESEIVFIGGGTQVTSATAAVTGIDITRPREVDLIMQDVIYPFRSVFLNEASYEFATMPTANANTRLIDALHETSFTTYPIANVALFTGGAGYVSVPQVNVLSKYNVVSNSATIIGTSSLDKLNILGDIEVVSGGTNYLVNNTINFIGGSGVGAYANVTQVAANGAIEKVEYVRAPTGAGSYPLGGMGYSILPRLTVNSISGNNAVLRITAVLGDGESVKASTDDIGKVEKIDVIQEGEDYVSVPTVSLRIVDIILTGVSRTDTPEINEIIYQGSIGAPSFRANTYSFEVIDEENDYYLGRFYNYTGTLNSSSPIKADKNISGDEFYQYNVLTSYNTDVFENGVNFFGNGRARANAFLLTGTTAYDGKYLNSDGHLSSYCRLQNEVYNNYTYFIDVEKSFSSYKELVENLLNPAGSQFLGKHIIKDKEEINVELEYNSGYKLANLTSYANSSVNAVILSTETNGGDLVRFSKITPYIGVSNLSSIISPNTKVSIKNNSYSVYIYEIVVKKPYFITNFPSYGSIVYQGNGTNPSFYGKFDSATLINARESIYSIKLFDCYGIIYQQTSSQIYSDVETINDKFYYYDVQTTYDTTPYNNGYYTYNNREIYYSSVSTVYDANTTIKLNDYYLLRYNNVVYGYTSSNTFVITELTGNFDKINNGEYSSTRKLNDIIFSTDILYIQNNSNVIVNSINYQDGIIYCNKVLTSAGNSTSPVLLSVERNFNSNEIFIEH
jgi:hypothetical protein